MTSAAVSPFRVMFVCTGNICRSPMAEVVFRHMAVSAGLHRNLAASSSGLGDWHVGEHADSRTIAALRRRGYDGSAHRAQQFRVADFDRQDLLVALDRSHERALSVQARTPSDADKIALLLSFDPDAGGRLDVPDPYYDGRKMFDDVLDMIERASRALFSQLEPALRLAH